MKFWQKNYSKINTEALFASVDENSDGQIQRGEWIKFWADLKKKGYTEQDILDELTMLNTGSAWMLPSNTKFGLRRGSSKA